MWLNEFFKVTWNTQNERGIDVRLPWHHWDATMREIGSERMREKSYIWCESEIRYGDIL